MTTEQTAVTPGINITDKALEHIRAAMQKEGIAPELGGLRLGVQGGGCSGLSYNIRFDTQPRERDRIFEFGDVRVFVDPKSFIYLSRHDGGMGRDADASRLCLPEPECKEELRLRQQLFLKETELSDSRRELNAGLQVMNEQRLHRDHRCWSCGDMRAEHFCAECGHVQPAEPTDFFSFFGLPRKLELDEAALEHEFHALSRKLHPDVYSRASAREQAWSLEKTSQLNDAYRTLEGPAVTHRVPVAARRH